LSVWGALGCGKAASTQGISLQEPKPVNAADAIFDAFDKYPVVALGMSHWQKDLSDFSLTLLRDPRFAQKVGIVVIEAGNALYQPTLDRYIAGEDVPFEQVKLVWLNTTQPGRADSTDLVRTVREVNLKLPPSQRIRVLAGDPPVDWKKIRTPKDMLPYFGARDTNFASVVLNEVLGKHKKALLVIGSAHVFRHSISWASDKQAPPPTVTNLIEKRYPNSTFVICPHDDFGLRNAELEPRLNSWPKPSLAIMKGTWLGELDAGTPLTGKIMRIGSDPSKPDSPYPGLKMQDLADAYLYLGPVASLKRVVMPVEPGEAYAREIRRRDEMIGEGPPISGGRAHRALGGQPMALPPNR